MSHPFDRWIIRQLEKQYCKDHNLAQSQVDWALRHVARSLFASGGGMGPSSFNQSSWVDGFLGDSFKVYPPFIPGFQVIISAGVGFFYKGSGILADGENAIVQGYTGVPGLDDESAYKPVVLSADLVFEVPTPPVDSETARIDIIEVRIGRRLSGIDTTNKFLNTGTGAFDDTVVDKTLTFSLNDDTGTVSDPSPSTASLSYKAGISGANPSVPSVTAGYVKIAEIRVADSTTAVDRTCLKDFRRMLFPYGVIGCPIRFNMNNATSPSSFHGSFPPGVEVHVVGVSGQPREAHVYVIGNLSSGRLALSPGIFPGNWLVSLMQGPNYALLSSDVTAIGSSLNANGACQVAVKDQAMVFDVYSESGATNDVLQGVLTLGT